MTGSYSVHSLVPGMMCASVLFVLETFSPFVWNHVSILYMYSCRCVAETSWSGSSEKTVISSTYDSRM